MKMGCSVSLEAGEVISIRMRWVAPSLERSSMR